MMKECFWSGKLLCFFTLSLLLLSVAIPAGAETPEIPIAILKSGDPLPAGARFIRQLSYGSDRQGAAPMEWLEQARNQASELGANLIRILEPEAQRGLAFSVAFYHTANIRAAEQRFNWSKDRKLVWEDFKGSVRQDAGDRTVAETACGIGFETNTVTAGNQPRIFVFNTFEASSSWVRSEEATQEVLQHEQSHFDICELYTRKLRERFSSAVLNARNLEPVMRSIYTAVEREYTARQQDYERQTRHGINAEAQQRWTTTIDLELKQSEQWMSR